MNKQLQNKLAAVLIFAATGTAAFATPRIITQPTNYSVSIGDKVTFLVTASSTNPPISYLWSFNNGEITNAKARSLLLTNIQSPAAGGYSVVVSDTSGSVTSIVATLEVDPAFTVILASPIHTDNGFSASASWGDYDNDGFADLWVGNISGPDFLYRNKGDGTFERLLTNVIGGLSLGGGGWADYDNDGLLDMYTVSGRDSGVHFYHNQGNGTMVVLTNAAVTGSILTTHAYSGSTAWGDYDNDGFVDLYVANGTFGGDIKNFLFHNSGDGTFARVTNGSPVTDNYECWTGAWADYDDDGWLDLFVTSNGGFTPSGKGEDNQLYHNDGPSGFTKLTAEQMGVPPHDSGFSRGCAWGDYDNDGRLDLFVAGHTNLLYHNIGGGKFEKITEGKIVKDTSINESIGCSWVDYDNDGYLDMLVVNVSDVNFLYHNSGDGTFTRVDSGSLVNDDPTLSHIDAAWADYDNDGFMDVVVVADGGKSSLFRNAGNSNNWINLKLVGTASNRQAIGAKVRLKATIGGKSFWQRRDIGASTSQLGQSDLRACFGLGNATNIDTVRIEWPSGTVQELHNLHSKQFLTVTEPARLKVSAVNGQYQLGLNGGVGFGYDLQVSTNLVDWATLANVVTTNMTMPVMSLDVTQTQQYFRTIAR